MSADEVQPCSNCGSDRDVRLLSYDLDLPPVRLCGICSVTIVAQPDMFAEMGRPRGKRTSGGAR